MVLTFGQQTEVRFVEESTDGTFPTNPDLDLFSQQTKSVSLSYSKNLLEGTDLQASDVNTWVFEEATPSLEVEFLVDSVADLQKFAERESDSSTRSFGLEVITNSDQTNQGYLRLAGCRPSTVEITGSVGSAWTATIEFLSEGFDTTPTQTDPGIGTGSRETASSITESVKTFQGALIQQDSSTWATIVNNFSATIDHQTEVDHTTGSQDPTTVTHAERLISGSADISFEDGLTGGAFANTNNESEVTINLDWGQSSGDPAWDFTTTVFPSWEPDISVGDRHIVASREWQAQSITFGTV